jgi:hypothetical protein
MRAIGCLLLVFMLGCRADKDNAIGPERSANAIIHASNVYVDGCELHLRLDSGTLPNTGTQYKFTSASLPLVQRVLSQAALNPQDMVNLPVTVRYRETGNKSVITCGWVSPTVTEISILEISRR